MTEEPRRLRRVDGASADSGSIAITDVTVVGGDGGESRARARVLVKGGEIAAVDHSAEVPPGYTEIPGAGRYLIPGLWDTHVHVSADGGRHRRGWFGAPGGAVPGVVANLESYLDNGVTTVVDMGGRADVLKAARETRSGARVLFSGGHFNWAGGSFVVPWMNRLVGTVADAVAEVDRARAEEQVDLVKIVYSCGLPSHPPAAKLAPEIVAAIARRARELGLTSATHGDAADDVLEAIDAGVDSTEHMFHPSGDWRADRARVLEACLEHDTWWPMTIVLFEAQARARDESWLARFEPELRPSLVDEVRADPDSMWLNLPEVDREDASRRLDAALETAALASSAGVRMTIGTDAGITGIFHGLATHRELELHAQAGISPARILAMATRDAASRFGQQHDVGTVEPGKRADLVLLSRDPLADVRNLRAIDHVIQAGSVVRSAE